MRMTPTELAIKNGSVKLMSIRPREAKPTDIETIAREVKQLGITVNALDALVKGQAAEIQLLRASLARHVATVNRDSFGGE